MIKKYKLAVSPDAQVESDTGVKTPSLDEIRKLFTSSLREAYEAFHAPQLAKIKILTHEAFEHQKKCRENASELLALYWGPGGQSKIQSTEMENWVSKNEPFDLYFFIHLIEVAGEKANEVGYSRHKSDIARAKNAAPRAWVAAEWENRQDKEQKKSEFGRVYAKLVGIKFNLVVTAETIARDWIPKNIN